MPKDVRAELERRVRAALEAKLRDWDELVREGRTSDVDPEDADAWGSMPAIDSKVVVELIPVFEDVLDCTFSLKLIRAGGYDSEEDLVAELIPAALEDAARRRSPSTRRGQRSD